MQELQRLPLSGERSTPKQNVLHAISNEGESALTRYRNFFVGRPGLAPLLRYELAMLLARNGPGAIGYLLRKWLYGTLCGSVGTGVQWGSNIALRHPAKMRIGAGCAFDDDCTLDARGAADGEFTIGRSALVARGSILLVKSGFLSIGDQCTVGAQCFIGSFGGIRIGDHVGIAGACYIGGARYEPERTDVPMKDQPAHSEGPIDIGDDCWIGAGARILDGVKIGPGSIIGAGAIIRESIPARTVATPHQRLILLPRHQRQ